MFSDFAPLPLRADPTRSEIMGHTAKAFVTPPCGPGSERHPQHCLKERAHQNPTSLTQPVSQEPNILRGFKKKNSLTKSCNQ